MQIDRETPNNKINMYIKQGHNPILPLKIMFQIVAIHRNRIHIPIQRLEAISMVANIVTNKKWSYPQGLEFSVLPFLFMRFIPLQY